MEHELRNIMVAMDLLIIIGCGELRVFPFKVKVCDREELPFVKGKTPLIWSTLYIILI